MRGGARLLIVGLSITVAGTLAACGGTAATPLPTLPPETPTPLEPSAVVETLPPAETASPALETAAPEATDQPATTKKYRVKKGDTMIGIAAKFGITLKALQKANPKVKPRELKVGQVLIIPAQ